jgi:hypothetical protein
VTDQRWPRRTITAIYIRVPTADWSAVKRGIKTEFRAKGRSAEQLWRVPCPTPAVCWRAGKNTGREDSRLMVLEATWMEALRDISPESLAREGFSSFPEFRRYWMIRHKSKFPPLMEVRAYRVRPFTSNDSSMLSRKLLERLYGEHLGSIR